MSFTKRPPRSLIQEFRDFKSVSNATTVEFLGEGELYLPPSLSLSRREHPFFRHDGKICGKLTPSFLRPREIRLTRGLCVGNWQKEPRTRLKVTARNFGRQGTREICRVTAKTFGRSRREKGSFANFTRILVEFFDRRRTNVSDILPFDFHIDSRDSDSVDSITDLHFII